MATVWRRTIGSAKHLLILTALTAALVTCVRVGWNCALRLLADRWQEELSEAPDDQIGRLVHRLAQLGKPGMVRLVDALESEREQVARAAREMLTERIEEASIANDGASEAILAALAETLAARLEQSCARERPDATALANRLLRCSRLTNTDTRRRLVAACEKIFREMQSHPILAVSHPVVATMGGPPNVKDQAQNRAVPMAPSQSSEAAGTSLVLREPRSLPSDSVLVDIAPVPSANRDREKKPDEASPNLPLEPAKLNHIRNVSTTGRLAKTAQDALVAPAGVPDAPRQISLANKPQQLPTPTISQPLKDRDGSSLSWGDCVKLMRQLHDANAQVSVAAEAKLTSAGMTANETEVAKKLFSPDAKVRRRLAQALPQIPGIDAGPWLLQLAQDQDAEVRRTAIALLATTGDRSLVAQARRLAEIDDDPRIQEQAERMIERTGLAGQRR